jgi:hypothetical protein
MIAGFEAGDTIEAAAVDSPGQELLRASIRPA